jgi:hypothetical protein
MRDRVVVLQQPCFPSSTTRAAAIVLNDLASSAYYVGGILTMKSKSYWFILVITSLAVKVFISALLYSFAAARRE